MDGVPRQAKKSPSDLQLCDQKTITLLILKMNSPGNERTRTH